MRGNTTHGEGKLVLLSDEFAAHDQLPAGLRQKASQLAFKVPSTVLLMWLRAAQDYRMPDPERAVMTRLAGWEGNRLEELGLQYYLRHRQPLPHLAAEVAILRG